MIRLERLRLDRLLTRQQLAKQSGVSRQTIVALEKGRVEEPHMETLKRLSSFFDCAPSELLSESSPSEVR
jgi:transcriptional regulator with XRE-family HTH domain